LHFSDFNFRNKPDGALATKEDARRAFCIRRSGKADCYLQVIDVGPLHQIQITLKPLNPLDFGHPRFNQLHHLWISVYAE
jgi:hypothetical protein